MGPLVAVCVLRCTRAIGVVFPFVFSRSTLRFRSALCVCADDDGSR